MIQVQAIREGDAVPLTVSDFNRIIRDYVDSAPLLSDVAVQGQVSGHRSYDNGNSYFSLVDAQTAIKCVFFSGGAGQNFLEDGAQVIVYGKVSYYERRGELNIRTLEVKPYGLGAVQKEFEVLKAKLQAEGLFDSTRKRALPLFPKRVAVVTSPESAALQDILKVFKERYPLLTVIVAPVTVGGENAAQSIIDGLALVQRAQPDVCVLARGGGSPEDLWPFNNETLARAIFAFPIPTVTGIGHETDITIADYVADCRAASPSAAAERITPDRGELMSAVMEQMNALNGLVNVQFRNYRDDIAMLIDRFSDSGQFEQRFGGAVDAALERCDNAVNIQMKLHRRQLGAGVLTLSAAAPDVEAKRQLTQQLLIRASQNLTNKNRIHKTRVQAWERHLEALSPARVLRRGYSIATLKNGAVLKSSAQVNKGDIINLELSKGKVRAAAISKQGATAKKDDRE